ncbi:hypothetical protein [Sphingosinicella humi]|uniref:Uncharacterized protein n=1 Tax=Allosphingosinicella humi TaxID=2068657 RepID=A0A2U2J2W8_9SPHN|nr:hypothetical protein [Sphingosinicella humi]PWG02621.1 hypothetical protein DF286_06895 [Sphingosinicella humi]
MSDLEEILQKLKQPPSVPNWTRYIHDTQAKTTTAVAKFALGFPKSALFQVYRIIGDMVSFGITEEEALKAVALIKNPLVSKLGREIVLAFSAYNKEESLEGIQVFQELVGYFRVSRDVVVPVKPTFVILEHGRPTPVFVIGWTTNPFTRLQKRLLTTAIDDAILSFGDFAGSHAKIICAPRISKVHRVICSWSTADYPRLDSVELAQQLEFYSQALVEAVPLITEELNRRAALAARKSAQESVGPISDPTKPAEQDDLFR